jgi:hypothetical protein
MITEDRKRDTTKPKKKFELAMELKKTKGVPHYIRIDRYLISGLN